MKAAINRTVFEASSISRSNAGFDDLTSTSLEAGAHHAILRLPESGIGGSLISRAEGSSLAPLTTDDNTKFKLIGDGNCEVTES